RARIGFMLIFGCSVILISRLVSMIDRSEERTTANLEFWVRLGYVLVLFGVGVLLVIWEVKATSTSWGLLWENESFFPGGRAFSARALIGLGLLVAAVDLLVTFAT